MKTYEAKSGWSVVMDRGASLYSVILRNIRGDVVDKVRCDDYESACEYYGAFKRQAKTAYVHRLNVI